MARHVSRANKTLPFTRCACLKKRQQMNWLFGILCVFFDAHFNCHACAFISTIHSYFDWWVMFTVFFLPHLTHDINIVFFRILWCLAICFFCCYCYCFLFLCFYFWISSFILDLDDTVVTNGCSPNNKPKLINGTAWNGPPPFLYTLLPSPSHNTQTHISVFNILAHGCVDNTFFSGLFFETHIMLTEHNT